MLVYTQMDRIKQEIRDNSFNSSSALCVRLSLINKHLTDTMDFSIHPKSLSLGKRERRVKRGRERGAPWDILSGLGVQRMWPSADANTDTAPGK